MYRHRLGTRPALLCRNGRRHQLRSARRGLVQCLSPRHIQCQVYPIGCLTPPDAGSATIRHHRQQSAVRHRRREGGYGPTRAGLRTGHGSICPR